MLLQQKALLEGLRSGCDLPLPTDARGFIRYFEASRSSTSLSCYMSQVTRSLTSLTTGKKSALGPNPELQLSSPGQGRRCACEAAGLDLKSAVELLWLRVGVVKKRLSEAQWLLVAFSGLVPCFRLKRGGYQFRLEISSVRNCSRQAIQVPGRGSGSSR